MPWVAPCAVVVMIEQCRACAACGARLKAVIAPTATAATSDLVMAHSSSGHGARVLSPLTAYNLARLIARSSLGSGKGISDAGQRPYTSAPCRLALSAFRSSSRNCIGNVASPDRDEPLAVVVDLDQTAMAVGTVLTYHLWNHSDDNGQARSPGHWQCSEPHTRRSGLLSAPIEDHVQ